MSTNGILSLKWIRHQETFVSFMTALKLKNVFCDVSIVCGGQIYSAHKIILAMSSPYFQQILSQLPDVQHHQPVVIVLQDIFSEDFEVLLDYMYNGEATVHENKLSRLLQVSEKLKVRGLAGLDSDEDLARDNARMTTLTGYRHLFTKTSSSNINLQSRNTSADTIEKKRKTTDDEEGDYSKKGINQNNGTDKKRSKLTDDIHQSINHQDWSSNTTTSEDISVKMEIMEDSADSTGLSRPEETILKSAFLDSRVQPDFFSQDWTTPGLTRVSAVSANTNTSDNNNGPTSNPCDGNTELYMFASTGLISQESLDMSRGSNSILISKLSGVETTQVDLTAPTIMPPPDLVALTNHEAPLPATLEVARHAADWRKTARKLVDYFSGGVDNMLQGRHREAMAVYVLRFVQTHKDCSISISQVREIIRQKYKEYTRKSIVK